MKRERSRLLCGTLFLVLAPYLGVVSHANPSGGVVRHGEITFEPRGNTLRLYQTSDRGIIDWDSFSIASGEATRFIQPRVDSVTMNRVTGQTVSRIDGSLVANGRIFLLNPNGIVVGRNGVIDVAGFAASTLDLSDGEFLAGGDFRFRGNSRASVVNLGKVTAFDGDVFLVASSVINEGSIRAANGTVGLAAGNEVLIAESGSERVFVKGSSGSNREEGVVNRGDVEANIAELKSYGGNLYGMAVQNQGRVAATGVTRSGGQIFLSAGGDAPSSGGRVSSSGTLVARPVARPDGTQPDLQAPPAPRIEVDAGNGGGVDISGRVDASAEEIGGTVIILGETIDLFPESLILADGEGGGGRILIGGGRRGGDPAFNNAVKVTVDDGARISASGTLTGDGGEVVLFAEQDLVFEGLAEARGGAQSGDGGFVELSGKRSVAMGKLTESVDVRAARGSNGDLLFDPEEIRILPGFQGEFPDGSTVAPVSSASMLYSGDVSDFLQNFGSLRIETDLASTEGGDGDITLVTGAGIAWTSSNDLEILANGSFFMQDDSFITSRYAGTEPGGNVAISAGTGLQLGDRGIGSTKEGAGIRTETGNVRIRNTGPGGAAMKTGIQLHESSILTATGDILIDGSSTKANLAGLGIYNSRVVSNGGGDGEGGSIELSGSNQAPAGGRSASGLRISSQPGPPDSLPSLPVIGTTAGKDVSLAGETRGNGFAIDLFGQLSAGSSFISTPGGGAINRLDLKSGGGRTFLTDIRAGEVGFELAPGGLGTLQLGGDFSFFESPRADGIILNQGGSDLTLGDIHAGESFALSFSSNRVEVSGNLNASEEATFQGTGVDNNQTLEFRMNSSAPRVLSVDVNFVDVWESIGLDQFAFDGVEKVRAVGVTDQRVTGSDSDSTVRVFSGNGEVPLTIPLKEPPGLEIGLPGVSDTGDTVFVFEELVGGGQKGGTSRSSPEFHGFREASGGGGADVFAIGLNEGSAFTGMLFGGLGDDRFEFTDSGEFSSDSGGARFLIGSVVGEEGTDTVDFSAMGSPVVADFGQSRAEWNGGAGRVAMISTVEAVVGSRSPFSDILRGTDQGDEFVITENDSGFLNGARFFGFEELQGVGGDDRFSFLNQARLDGGVDGGTGFDVLTINDRNLSGDNTYTIGSNSIVRDPVYTFEGLETLQLLLGPGDDTVETQGNGLTQQLDGGFGFDSIDFGGADVTGTDPFVVGGSSVFAVNFEDPATPVAVGDEKVLEQGGVLLQQGGSPPERGTPAVPRNSEGNGSSASGDGNLPLASDLGLGAGNAFGASPIVNQAVVIPLAGQPGSLDIPIGLDGAGTPPPPQVIEALKSALGPQQWRELAESIGFAGGTILLNADGPYATDLSGVPPEEILAISRANLLAASEQELVDALELALVVPITSIDGPVGIVGLPIAIDPAIAIVLSEQSNQEAFSELASALDLQ